MTFNVNDLVPMLPELFLAVAGMVLLIAGVFRGDKSTSFISWGAIVSFIIAGIFLLGLDWDRHTVLNDMFIMDQFAGLVKLLILIGLIASIALSVQYLYQSHIVRFEYPILVMFAGIGMMLMVSANDLLALYMGLELQSLSLYVLASIRRDHIKSAEAGMKYFILGAISSGMLLFGISLVYGYTGTTNFDLIHVTLGNDLAIGAVIGLVFILAGIAFKISAVPFHMWTPDVYEGAPTSVTALFAIVPKLAAVALLIRVLFYPFAAAYDDWVQIIWFLSAASMTLAAFAAIAQTNIKRLMAYSSIGNMGYALIGLVALSKDGLGSVIVYMTIYMVMTAGAFGLILCMRRDGKAVDRIEDLAGLSTNAPVMAYALAILMFSMSGIPPMAGFFGKLLVFEAAIAAEFYVLAILGVLTSVVAAYYYLRVIKVMFFDPPVDKFDTDISFARRAVIFLSIIFVLGFIIIPSPFIETARQAASAFFGS